MLNCEAIGTEELSHSCGDGCCVAGMWSWQGGAGAAAGAGGAEGAHAPHELSDMLQILDQSGTATFEDLNINMFNSNFE